MEGASCSAWTQGKLYSEKDVFLWEVIKIPHVAAGGE